MKLRIVKLSDGTFQIQSRSFGFLWGPCGVQKEVSFTCYDDAMEGLNKFENKNKYEVVYEN